MTKISLRAYIQEIEGIIDRGLFDESIAHCKYILQLFPKHIDTYRLLGKSYLEAKRFQEASDIFQRVLSSLPDDFVSQIGMSIIREEEGNLDASIWHMERAFEVMPSTPTVQDELKRLYSKRDGIEPSKVRLTRGALVRMYARSELYPQAIAEIRAALAENPERVDLEVILAKMYMQSGQKNEAADLAGKLLIKLPFCLEANKILAEVVASSAQTQEVDIYHQHIIALDPYEAFISSATPTLADVPANAVMLDILETDGNATEISQPVWAPQTVKPEPVEKSNLPDWLKQDEKSDQQSVESSSQVNPESVELSTSKNDSVSEDESKVEDKKEETEIPDWMRSLGWSEPGTSETSSIGEENSMNSSNQDLTPAEIPDWLQSLAPTSKPDEDTDIKPPQNEPQVTATENNEAEIPQEESNVPVELPDWLTEEEIINPPPLSSTATEEIKKNEEPEEPKKIDQNLLSDEPLPEWIAQEKPAVPEIPSPSLTQQSETPEVNTSDSDIPSLDWLQSLKSSASQNQQESKPQEESTVKPTWTEEISPGINTQGEGENSLTTEDNHINPDTELPDWLKPTPDTDPNQIDKSSSEVPAWLSNEQNTQEQKLINDVQPIQDEDIPDWLKEMKQRAAEEPQSIQQPHEEQPPDWLIQTPDEIKPENEDVPLQSDVEKPIASDEPLTLSEKELPSWLKPDEQAISNEEEIKTETSLDMTVDDLASQPVEDLSSWLKTLDQNKSEPETGILTPEEPEIIPEEFLATQEGVSEQVTEIAAEPIKDKLDWMLGEQPSISEETPITPVQPDKNIPTEGIATPEASVGVPITQELEEVPAKPVTEVQAGITAETELPEKPDKNKHIEDVPESDSLADMLRMALEGLSEGDLKKAVEYYQKMIHTGKHLSETIESIKDGLYRYPVDTGLWQTLGDALAKNKQIKEALEAYTKAEELLR